MKLIDKILMHERIVLMENQRAIHLWKGQVQDILGPGEHILKSRGNRLRLEMDDLARPEFISIYEKAIFEKLPEIAAEHFTAIRTGRTEVAVIERDGKIYGVIGPDSKRVFWTDAGPWKHKVIDIAEHPVVEPKLAKRLGVARQADQTSTIAVGDGQSALLFFDGEFQQLLKPGIHTFWSAAQMVQHKLVDLKKQAADVTGQEVLTRDRVTIRVNISAEYQVTDPVKAVMEVKDFNDALYRSLQLAFRKALGTKTLDQVLEQKAVVDAKTADKVRKDMAQIGITVGEIMLKDVILPGDMRELLNQVVAAEKEAEANVIRRREETNATRSLLNTAKVMADNPVMLRLKELEALEIIAAQVDTITVHSGTDGLMNDLVNLRK